MSVVIGLFTLLCALAGMLLPVGNLLLLYRSGRELDQRLPAVPLTRDETETVFLLQGVRDLYADGDYVNADGTRHVNWFHRTLVFLDMVKYPTLIGAGVGFAIDNLINLIYNLINLIF